MLTCLGKTNFLSIEAFLHITKRLKSKKSHSLDKIFSFYISDDAIKIKVNESSSPLFIVHAHDFRKYFPDVDLSPPERSE